MAQQAHKAHVAPWKKKEVEDIEHALTKNKVIAVVTIGGIPSSSMQKIRAGLRGKAEVRSGKNNLLQLALEGAEQKVPGIKELEKIMDGQTALVASELNPFALYKQFTQSRTKMAAKAGQKAPFDIEIQKGDTPFKPGPVVGELQKAGIPAAIDQGKVVIKSTKVVVKKGDVISADLASALAKLEIHPIEVGLDVKGIFENGFLYKPDVLAIDETEFRNRLARAARAALGLALEIGWATKTTIEPLVGKAAKEALAVGAATKTLTKDNVPEYLRTAFLQMSALMKQKKGEELDEDEKKALGAAQAAAAPAAKAESKKEEKKDEEPAVSEEEAAAGLGSLFG
jgi:large subunit ribosomal protein L10